MLALLGAMVPCALVVVAWLLPALTAALRTPSPAPSPVPARERDPALVAIARELDAQGLTSPDVPRAITARTRAASHHARASPWPSLGGTRNDRPN